ncbi:hypothetical protein [Candidatus Mycobacterium methanotrophicum]|uniref:Heme peroxidase n=2 Tax=Candidatus Mycobacterium methanotrophicum TaxID=2943498 RepID=A0ABY4QLX8_9MYCO|nr:hypothetical protein [Candidatus Mycobacterium methanotrophicum]UQX10660.1 hypothetical protein M5I08_22025 [Candidatus Mycobacterium methanotrophicum]
MPHTAEQLHVLVAACEQFRGSKAPAGYRDGLALCVIDSVQSTGVTYSSVENVVARYRAYRREQGGDPNRDGVAELLATFDELGGPAGWAKKIGNSNRTSTRGGVLKSEAIRDAARVLDGEGIRDTDSLRKLAQDDAQLEQVRKAWLRGHGATFRDHVALHADARRHPGCEAGPDDLPVRGRLVGAASARCHAAVRAGDPDCRGEGDGHVAHRPRSRGVAVPADPEVGPSAV